MDQLEMVERLREKTNATYEEAKAALERADWDMLDAIVILEREGKGASLGGDEPRSSQAFEFSTKENHTNHNTSQAKDKNKEQKLSGMNAFMEQVGIFLMAASRHFIEVGRQKELLIRAPVLFVLAILLLLNSMFPFFVFLFFVSLFFGIRYRYVVDEDTRAKEAKSVQENDIEEDGKDEVE